MNVSAPFIRRPVGTSLLAIGLFLAGIIAFQFMPVAAIPRVDFPMVSVSARCRAPIRPPWPPRWPRRWNGAWARLPA